MSTQKYDIIDSVEKLEQALTEVRACLLYTSSAICSFRVRCGRPSTLLLS